MAGLGAFYNSLTNWPRDCYAGGELFLKLEYIDEKEDTSVQLPSRRAPGAKLLASSLALATALAFASSAQAQEEAAEDGFAGAFSGNVAITSNYLYRGITQSGDGPAIQGGFDYAVNQFYAGVWASSVEFGDNTSTEIDYYAGFSPTYEQFTFDVGVLYYSYPDAIDTPEQNFVEIYGGVSTTVQEMVKVGFSVAYSPEFYAETGPAWYPALDVSVPFAEIFSAGFHYGYQSFSDDDNMSYSEYNLSLTASFEGFDFTLGYSDTSQEAGDENDTVFVSIGRTF
jgi:uncharacterized protein (TIGR02001 family)